MDKGAFAERRGENREPPVFEISEPEPVAPPQPSGPPQPVLLFKPPEPKRFAKGARALLSSGAGKISEGANRLRGSGTGLTRVAPRMETGPTLIRDGRTWSIEGRGPLAPTGPVIASLTWIVAAVCATVWSVVGAIFWLPVVLGSILHFGAAHLQAMLDGEVPRAAGAGVRSAASFYVRGFSATLDIARAPSAPQPLRHPVAPASELRIQKGRLLRAAGWACVSWYAVLFIVGVVGWPHVELTDMASSIGNTMASVLADLTGAAARVSQGAIPGS